MTPYYQDDSTTLYHGDCRKVLGELPAASVQMVFADPPYGHNNNNGDLISRWEAALGRGDYVPERDNRPIIGDGADADALFESTIIECARLLKTPGACCCCCGGGGPDPMFARWSLVLDKHLQFKQMVVWDKGPMGMGWHYRRSYETVLVAQKSGGACAWYDETHKVENIIRHIKKIIPTAEQHPTQKPVGLVTHFLQLHTQVGDLILDPFMGSGTTGVACVQTGHKFIGIEIEERWCELSAKRIRDAAAQGRLF